MAAHGGILSFPALIGVDRPRESEIGASPISLRGHLPVLDGLRGLAILLVAVNHWVIAAHAELPGRVVRIVHSGWIGVDLFFVLSGFLITGILWDARGKAGYFKNFYARRALRIFPLYFAAVLLTTVILPLIFSNDVGRTGGIGRLAAQLQSLSHRQGWLWMYCSNIAQAYRPSQWHMAGHFWSLAVEEHFYLVWPAVLLFARERRRAMWICCGIAAIAVLVRIILVATVFQTVNVYFLTFCRMDSLAIGGLVALAIRGPRGIAPLILPARGIAIALGSGLIVWLLARGGLDNHGDALMQTIGFTMLGIFFAALLVTVVSASRSNPMNQIFRSALLTWFGKYSYGLYVFHHLLLYLIPVALPIGTLRAMTGSRTSAAFVLVAANVLLSLAAAYLSFHLFEKWFLRLKRRFETRPEARAIPVATPIRLAA